MVRSPGHLAILLGLALPLLFVGLGATALTDRDEGANAGAAREMLEQASWITPTLDYAPRFAKPAFVYWLMTAAYRTFGVGELGARLPSAVAAAALVFVQYAFARWAQGAATAFRAALILLLSVEYIAIGRMALTDATLVLWTTVAAFAFFRAHHGAPPSGPWYGAMYAAMALATLTKGPVGLVIPALAIVVYLAVAGGWRRAWAEARPGWGLLLFLLIAGPWYAAMFWRHGPEYVARARGETLGRAFRVVTGPGGTALFYIPVILIGFFPWSALLPSALFTALRGARRRAAADRRGAVAVFAAVWVLAGFTLFSLLQSRLPHYVAPLFPPAALLVAATPAGTVPSSARGLLAALGGIVGGALVVVYAMGPAVTPLLMSTYPAAPHAALSTGVLAIGILALAAGSTAALRDTTLVFRALALLTAGFLVVGLHGALPAFSAEFVAPGVALIRQAAAIAGPCDDLVAFGPYRPSFLFYARRPVVFVDVPDRSRLAEIAAGPGRLFLLTPRGLRDALPAAMAALPTLDVRGGYLLLASPPLERPCP